MRVGRCKDFEVTGDGSNSAWERVDWVLLRPSVSEGKTYQTRVKLLYSAAGLYVLFDGADSRLTATIEEDFADLWTEDVFEVFLWPDSRHPIYFEYEISPLGFELPILVPNIDGRFRGWRPWQYSGSRVVRKAVAVDGEQSPGAEIKGWRAEVFIPYKLLEPLANVPPEPGSRWRANFYRVDHDGGSPVRWAWSPVGRNFHDFERFGVLLFN